MVHYILKTSPEEHFKIKWGQAQAVGVICHLDWGSIIESVKEKVDPQSAGKIVLSSQSESIPRRLTLLSDHILQVSNFYLQPTVLNLNFTYLPSCICICY